MFLKILLEVAHVKRCLEFESHFLNSERDIAVIYRTVHMSSVMA